LATYRLPHEQRESLDKIEHVMNRHLANQSWSAIASAYIAHVYRRTLQYRMANP
jgi:hypothetical protein